jgi:F-type H+-transporting ATPase subunit b
MWKWVNFGILFAGLAFLAMKFGGPAFKARGEAIRKELDLARKVKGDSEAKVAEIERKLGNLSNEIESFRKESREMIAREGERISRETAQSLERVTSQAEHEITSLTNAARQGIKAEAARLALQLAEQKIAAGITPETQSSLVSAFAEDLGKVRS